MSGIVVKTNREESSVLLLGNGDHLADAMTEGGRRLPDQIGRSLYERFPRYHITVGIGPPVVREGE